MRKYSIVISFLVFVNVCFSQNPEIKTELPTIIPPSPTVSALMKFEEVPVSNYTGVPDISIPIYSTKLVESKLNFNLALSYHTASTKVEEIASNIGLGWSLTGVGTISRTVRDMPDEYLVSGSKFGIYRVNTLSNNDYYKALNVIRTFNQDWETLRSFMFDSNVHGIYDLQHDLWQYNFMGHSGRFYIEKQANGLLEVKMLENSTLKIINHYNPVNANTSVQTHYTPTGFTVYDDLGYKYVFDIVEETSVSDFSDSFDYIGVNTNSLDTYSYKSAFHLSKIFDLNGNEILLASYSNGGTEQNVSSKTLNTSSYVNLMGSYSNIAADFNLVIPYVGASLAGSFYYPMSVSSAMTRVYNPKKIDRITIPGQAKINFLYQTGRSDENYFNNSNSQILKSITIETFNDIVIKKIDLDHHYKYAPERKLFLKGVKQIANGQQIQLYDFEYKTPSISYQGVDAWGYLKGDNVSGRSKEVDIYNVDAFALEKMKLSTGGVVVIDYEPNTYSFIGDEEIQNFDENTYNWTEEYLYPSITSLNVAQNLIMISNPINKISINAPAVNGLFNWQLKIYKDGILFDDFLYENQNVFIEFSNLPVGSYTIKLTTPQYGVNPFVNNYQYPLIVKESYLVNQTNYKNYLYGGGFRVKSIMTFNQDVDTNNLSETPIQKKEYSYNFFDNANKSSGSLNSPKPVFNYNCSKTRPEIRVVFQLGAGFGVNTLPERVHNYQIISNRDIINRNLTKGSEIGYKNVSLHQTDNGKTNFEYLNSIDYPDIEMSSSHCLQLTPISNDYKRGHLIKEEIIDESGRILSLIENTFSFEQSEKISGLSIFGTYGFSFETNPVYKLFLNYSTYKLAKDNGHCFGNTMAIYCGIDFPTHTFGPNLDIGYNLVYERFGWAKLTSKTTKNYFYPNGGSTPNIVQTDETYTYNPLNKKISEQTVTNSNLNEVMKTKYFYLTTVDTPTSKNNISTLEKVETYRGSELLSTSKINYATNFPGNVSYLPQTITTSKGSNALENRVHYNRYDQFGHPLEVQQEHGMKTSYIYAYNSSQPVAKLENIGYANIPANLITAIQSATDSPNSNEAQVIDALNALRTSSDANLQKAIITTYTYKPLIGVSTITDPKGDKITYIYDAFNRLKEVRDKDNNILSENQYNYRP
jgi:YD repeat-containing protein